MTEEQEKLVIDNMRLVYHMIRKYNYDEDYASIGMIGLIKGVKTFDETKGYKISSYLCKCIINEILYSHRKKKDTPDKILNLDDYLVTENLTLIDCLEDKSINIENDLIEKEQNKKLKDAIMQLNEKEQYVISSLYGLYGLDKKKQSDLSREYNCSRSRISAMHKQILKKLRRIMESDNFEL